MKSLGPLTENSSIQRPLKWMGFFAKSEAKLWGKPWGAVPCMRARTRATELSSAMETKFHKTPASSPS